MKREEKMTGIRTEAIPESMDPAELIDEAIEQATGGGRIHHRQRAMESCPICDLFNTESYIEDGINYLYCFNCFQKFKMS